MVKATKNPPHGRVSYGEFLRQTLVRERLLLHNTTREKFLQEGQGYVALVIDAAYFVGLREYDTFSLAELFQLLKPLKTPLKIVRLALLNPVFRRSGARGAIYTLPAASTTRKAVGADTAISQADELGAEAFESLKAYRKALHMALFLRRPGRYLRALLARRLGVCKSTTRNYDRELGLQPQASYKFMPLDALTWSDLSEEKLKPHKYFLFIKHEGKQFFAPLNIQIAAAWQIKGATVYLVQQMGNVYGADRLAASYAEGEFSDFVES